MLWVLKEPSLWDCSFEHQQHMFKFIGKKIKTYGLAGLGLIWSHTKKSAFLVLGPPHDNKTMIKISHSHRTHPLEHKRGTEAETPHVV